jgi:hypothetical protein
VAFLYGSSVSDAERSELLRRLRERDTTQSLFAASTIAHSVRRDATPETAAEARNAVLYELQEWPQLDATHPRLAVVRDRLSNPAKATRVI